MSVAQQAEVIELPLSMVERLEALLGRLESRLAMPDAGEGILTTEEAMALARCRSTSAFCRWTKTWSVRAAGKNRWPCSGPARNNAAKKNCLIPWARSGIF